MIGKRFRSLPFIFFANDNYTLSYCLKNEILNSAPPLPEIMIKNFLHQMTDSPIHGKQGDPVCLAFSAVL